MKKCRKMTDLISKQQDQVRLSLFNRTFRLRVYYRPLNLSILISKLHSKARST